MPRARKERPAWDYTRKAAEQFGDQYLERKLIGRDMDVRGGVYYGTYGGEAIVVDPAKYPGRYDEYYAEAQKRARIRGTIHRTKVLRAVFDTVYERMEYSQSGVDEVLYRVAEQNGLPEFPDGAKVELSNFMGYGVGVCRHQALTGAVLLEQFKDEGYVRGMISVDRNMEWNPRQVQYDGHAWIRYTSHRGSKLVLDVAQRHFGPVEAGDWNYLRPEEQLPRYVGRSSIRGVGIEPPRLAFGT